MTTFRIAPIAPASEPPSPNNPNNPHERENRTMAYIYNADIYCDDFGKSIRQRIDAEGHAPADPNDEYSYDSGEYPKYADGRAEADSPQHCGSGDDCINSIKLSDGHEIGAWLENDLTTDGEEYVVEVVLEGGEVADLWRYYYEYLDFSIKIVCNGCGEDFDPDDLDDANFCEDCLDPSTTT